MSSNREALEIEANKVVLTGVSFECTNCEEVKPASEFGTRKMPGGVVRNQPQCKACRSRYNNPS